MSQSKAYYQEMDKVLVYLAEHETMAIDWKVFEACDLANDEKTQAIILNRLTHMGFLEFGRDYGSHKHIRISTAGKVFLDDGGFTQFAIDQQAERDKTETEKLIRTQNITINEQLKQINQLTLKNYSKDFWLKVMGFVIGVLTVLVGFLGLKK